MIDLEISTQPLHDWSELCRQHNSVIHSEEWQAVLQKSFNVETRYCYDATAVDGFAMTVFKAGPFRIGYIGFPIGGTIRHQPITDQYIQALSQKKQELNIHTIRFTDSAFAPQPSLDVPSVPTQETAIVDLNTWQSAQLPKSVRADLRTAERMGVLISSHITPDLAGIVWDMYRRTIIKHGGNMRYTQSYFLHLIELAQHHDSLKIWLARIDDGIVGYVVVLRDGDVAYYLHSAFDNAYQHYRMMDRLFLEMLTWSKQQEVRQFNFMSSPSGQTGLQFYKKKWGGITQPQHNYTVPFRPLMSTLFQWSVYVHNTVLSLRRKT